MNPLETHRHQGWARPRPVRSRGGLRPAEDCGVELARHCLSGVASFGIEPESDCREKHHLFHLIKTTKKPSRERRLVRGRSDESRS